MIFILLWGSGSRQTWDGEQLNHSSSSQRLLFCPHSHSLYIWLIHCNMICIAVCRFSSNIPDTCLLAFEFDPVCYDYIDSYFCMQKYIACMARTDTLEWYLIKRRVYDTLQISSCISRYDGSTVPAFSLLRVIELLTDIAVDFALKLHSNLHDSPI